MSYLVLGLFPSQMEADKVLLKLENAGYNNYILSESYKQTAQNVTIEKKIGFWSWLFDDHHFEQALYSYENTHTYNFSIEVATEQDVDLVKIILEKYGALNVEQKSKEYMPDIYSSTSKEIIIPESTNAKIIAKAKINLFFTNNRRHHLHENWIAEEPDGLGFKIN